MKIKNAAPRHPRRSSEWIAKVVGRADHDTSVEASEPE
jgi:hypothetical protein